MLNSCCVCCDTQNALRIAKEEETKKIIQLQSEKRSLEETLTLLNKKLSDHETAAQHDQQAVRLVGRGLVFCVEMFKVVCLMHLNILFSATGVGKPPRAGALREE